MQLGVLGERKRENKQNKLWRDRIKRERKEREMMSYDRRIKEQFTVNLMLNEVNLRIVRCFCAWVTTEKKEKSEDPHTNIYLYICIEKKKETERKKKITMNGAKDYLS